MKTSIFTKELYKKALFLRNKARQGGGVVLYNDEAGSVSGRKKYETAA